MSTGKFKQAINRLKDRVLNAPLKYVQWTPPQHAFLACDDSYKLLRTGNQLGKFLSNDTLVRVPNGWKPIGEIQEGEFVMGGDGSFVEVLEVHPQGIQECYRVTFNDGASVLAGGPHLWSVMDSEARFRKSSSRYRQFSLKTTQELYDKTKGCFKPKARPAIPVVGRFDSEDTHLPIDPYLLGVLIGDGCLRAGMIGLTSADEELVKQVESLLTHPAYLKKSKRKYNYKINQAREIKRSLMELGLYGHKSYTKFIPTAYLYASTSQRIALLQGLMDTDGSIAQSGNMEFSTVSEQLSVDIRELVCSLGGWASIKQRSTSYTYKGERMIKQSYRVRIRLPGIECFRLTRKKERRKDPVSTCNERLIYSIEPAGEYDCTCISVAHPDGLYVCTKDYIVTHNSFCGAADVVWRCLGTHPFIATQTPPVEIWVICNSWAQSIAIQGKIWKLVPKDCLSQDSGFNPKNGFVGVQKALHFRNGSILRVKTVQQDTMDLESATIHHVWIDEPIGNEEVFSALQARLRRTGGTVSITMTPATSGDLSWLRKLIEEGKITDLHFQLTADNLIPIGSSQPLKTEQGVPMDAAWVDEQIEATLPWARPVRCHGEWDFARTNHWFEEFKDFHIIPNLIASGKLNNVKLCLGMDYGDGKNRVCAVLAAVDDTGEHPKIYVLREYVPEDHTTPDMDAKGVLDMLKSAGISWRNLDYVYGDKNYTDAKGRVTLKSNAQMTQLIAKLLNTNTITPIFKGAKQGMGNHAGSVDAGCKFLHWSMIRADHFYVDSSCTWLIESLRKWDGTNHSKHKDIIDALRYALKDYIFKTTRSATYTVRIS